MKREASVCCVSQCSCRAQRDADTLSYPACREQLMAEGTVESVESGLPVAIVGECPCFIVQKHADAAVFGMAHQNLTLAIVPCADLVLIQLQAP